MNEATDTVTTLVKVESAWASKINWTQAVAAIAALITILSGSHYEVDPQMQANVVMIIGLIQSAVTIMLRTKYTTTITPSSADKVKGT